MFAEALNVTNNPLDLVQSVDKAPKEATNAEASTRNIWSSPAVPAINVAPIKGKALKEATNAEASIGTTQPSPAVPAIDIAPIKDKAPKEATNAEASTGTTRPSSTTNMVATPGRLIHLLEDRSILEERKDYVRINEETFASPQPLGLPKQAVSKYLSVHQEIIPVIYNEDKLKYLADYFEDEEIEVSKVLILARNSKAIKLLHVSLGRDIGLKYLGLS